MKILKKVLFWNYGRSTWQYDILCLLILAFIFLTPRSWFESSKLRLAAAHPTRASTLLVMPGLNEQTEPSRAELERRVREATGRPAVITNVRPRRDEAGRVVAFEVDIQ